MTCSPPFQKVKNIGCIFLYFKSTHTQEEGLAHCQSLGAELFEFNNFDQQNEDVFKYLIDNGGKLLLLSVIRSHPIRLSTASITGANKDDIWIGLKRARNKNFYWPISGNQVEHRETKNIWYKGEPTGHGDCIFIDLDKAKHIKNSFRDYNCTFAVEVSFCQIPFFV